MTTTLTRTQLVTRYTAGGLAIVPIPHGSKGPNGKGWNQPQNAITTPEAALQHANSHKTAGYGLLHSVSRTAAMDVDHSEWAKQALAAVGIDLQAISAANPYRVRGKRGEKPIWRLPEGAELSSVKLAWPHPTLKDAMGNPVRVTVLEIRGGQVQDILPPTIHPDTGQPYVWVSAIPEHRTDLPELPHQLLSLWQRWKELLPVMEAACPWAERRATVPTAAAVTAARGQDSDGIIQAFNAAHPIAALLERFGYRPRGTGAWVYPGSESGQAGVKLLPDRTPAGYEVVYSHHAADPLGDEKPRDAFDVYCTLAHSGDVKAAVKAAAAELGLSRPTSSFLDSSQNGTDKTDTTDEGMDPWPLKPLDLPPERPPAPRLPLELIPAPLLPWIQDAAERWSMYPEVIAGPAVVVLGAVIGRQLSIRPKQYDDWAEYPNVWGGVVMPPGSMKTSALKEVIGPVERLASRAREEYTEALREHELDVEMHEAKLKGIKDRMAKAARTGKDTELSRLAEERRELAEGAAPTERRYTTQDATMEALLKVLARNPRGMLLYRDELAGWLRGMERQGRENERPFFLEAWSGRGNFRMERISRDAAPVQGMCLSVLGGIQHGKFKGYVAEAMTDGDGADGLLQRFQVLIWPDDIAPWKLIDRAPDRAAKALAIQIFERLDNIDTAALAAVSEDDEPPYLRFTPDAQALFFEWWAELETKVRTPEVQKIPAFAEHLFKYKKLMPALALMFPLVDWAAGEPIGQGVTLRAPQLAAAWCGYLEGHAAKLYAEYGSGDTAHALLKMARSGELRDGESSVRDLYRLERSGFTKPLVFEALDTLERLGWMQIQRVQSGKKGGRTREVVRLHPCLTGIQP